MNALQKVHAEGQVPPMLVLHNQRGIPARLNG
jgi:hypothetical protein